MRRPGEGLKPAPMNAPVKPPANALPEWRLDDLYAGRDDPRIEADLAEAARISGELAALQGVVKFPVRIKCATLSWNTLAQALDEVDAESATGT